MHLVSNPGAATTRESWHSHRSELSDVEEMERAKVFQTTTLTTISYFFQYSTRLSIKYLKTVHCAMLWIKINANEHSGCELLIWEQGEVWRTMSCSPESLRTRDASKTGILHLFAAPRPTQMKGTASCSAACNSLLFSFWLFLLDNLNKSLCCAWLWTDFTATLFTDMRHKATLITPRG